MGKNIRLVFHSLLLIPMLTMLVAMFQGCYMALFKYEFFKIESMKNFVIFFCLLLLTIAVFGICIYFFYLCEGFWGRLLLTFVTSIVLFGLCLSLLLFSGSSTASVTDSPEHWGIYDAQAKLILRTPDLSNFPVTAQGEVVYYNYRFIDDCIDYHVQIHAAEILQDHDYETKQARIMAEAGSTTTTADGKTAYHFGVSMYGELLIITLDPNSRMVEYQIQCTW